MEVELPGGSLSMRLLPYAGSSALALGKLAPDRNSVRAVRSDASDGALLPTPSYNTGIIEVCTTACSRCINSRGLLVLMVFRGVLASSEGPSAPLQGRAACAGVVMRTAEYAE